ncbi:EscE/YscE/SsaE family type III secretion system needle protein co-chaperone [Endozoicomonas sp. Mp262]|uniref:EscE/YscE/SsaE family type III secretion system needle protein co-chaperone n=1 Tax=Endozoicomonas sp. Mp262 TaxID=2919499 RepID=UPI0021D98FD3
MTTLEEQLKQDATGHYQLKLLDQLNHEGMRVNRILNQGCRPDEYKRYKALSEALAAAGIILKQAVYNLSDSKGY